MRFWNWDRRKSELNEELEAHVRFAIEDRIARGESPEQARAAALREIGNLPLVADTTRRQWGWERLERFTQDLRYAVRRLRKSPGYALTVILTLTLAIGANTAIFGLFYALFLRSLPVSHPEEIVQVKLAIGQKADANSEPTGNLSGKIFDIVSTEAKGLDGACAWESAQQNLHDASGTRPVPAATLSGGCFRMFGLHAALGRLFNESDDKHGGGPEGYAAVLSYNYWRSHLGGDPGVIGRVLDLQDKKAIIVGVLQPGFDSVTVGDRPWIYLPSEVDDPGERHGYGSFDRMIFARLGTNVPMSQFAAQIDAVYTAHLKVDHFQYVRFNEQGKMQMTSEAHLVVTRGRTGSSYLREQYEKPLYLVEGLVGISLLVACAYLALLASTRTLAQQRELAVRIALGAGRSRILAQIFVEALLLALAGAALGLLFAWAAGRGLLVLINHSSASDPLQLDLAPSGAVLLFALGISVLTLILSGVGPAWRASRIDPASDIKDGGYTSSSRRGRRIGVWLVPAQIGFSLILVLVAALMASTLARLLAVDPGFRTTGLTFMRADFSQKQEPIPGSTNEQVSPTLLTALLDRIRNTAGVQDAAISQTNPLEGAMYIASASSTAASGETRTNEFLVSLSVSPGYFSTLGVPMQAGHDFTSGDSGAAPEVCILSRSAAQFFFPGQNAVGKTLEMQRSKKAQKLRVVAVVGDIHYSGPREEIPRMLYMPYAQAHWNPYVEFSVRSQTASTGISAVREAFRTLAPDVALNDPVMVTDLVRSTMGREWLVVVLAGFFAALTVTLSAIGIYGLLNASVLRRRTEIGLRMALGSSRLGVVRLVLHEALWMVLPGLVLGAAGAWGLTRLLRSLLFGVKPLDPWMCALSAAVFAVIALLASALPARRAASVDPMIALRTD